MTTTKQAEIDEHRQRTLDERLASLWPGCRPCTTKIAASGRRVTVIDNPGDNLAHIEAFVEGYNAGMDDARRLIGPPGMFERQIAAPLAAGYGSLGGSLPPDKGRTQKPSRSHARAAAEALFKGGRGNAD